ncbi:MAG: hypothetical protein A2W22_05455 [Candidatus Levybacteria bacterium RBG_16_35_11]|nr:MAG: hypothetical protein A2W22_05455 [Candidatus Levybacteria bacterium RBG_16_35_11]
MITASTREMCKGLELLCGLRDISPLILFSIIITLISLFIIFYFELRRKLKKSNPPKKCRTCHCPSFGKQCRECYMLHKNTGNRVGKWRKLRKEKEATKDVVSG